MSILSSWWRAFYALLFPPHCMICGELLEVSEEHVCLRCRMTAPRTEFTSQRYNPLYDYLSVMVPIEQATALLYFTPGSPWRRLIHRFKYHHRAAFAREMGRWIGEALKKSDRYADLTTIVPLPLHPLRRLLRGYNQSEWLAEGIAEELGIRVDRGSVVRRRYTSPQALKSHRERSGNVAGAFTVRRPEQLTGGHVLLVDDVLTTGSSIVACADAILDEVLDCRVSVAVLAVTRHIVTRG